MLLKRILLIVKDARVVMLKYGVIKKMFLLEGVSC